MDRRREFWCCGNITLVRPAVGQEMSRFPWAVCRRIGTRGCPGTRFWRVIRPVGRACETSPMHGSRFFWALKQGRVRIFVICGVASTVKRLKQPQQWFFDAPTAVLRCFTMRASLRNSSSSWRLNTRLRVEGFDRACSGWVMSRRSAGWADRSLQTVVRESGTIFCPEHGRKC